MQTILRKNKSFLINLIKPLAYTGKMYQAVPGGMKYHAQF